MDKSVKADERLESLIERTKEEIKNNQELKDLINDKGEPVVKNLSNHMEWLLRKFDDVRLFGATMPLGKVKKPEVAELHLPAQFSLTGGIP